MSLTRRLVLGSLPATFAVPARAGVAWRMATEYPATAIPGEGVSFFADAAARLSSGAVSVQPGFDGVRSAAAIAAVRDGQLEAADAFSGGLAGEDPVFGLSALPFLTASAEDTARLLVAARPAYAAALATRGLTLLYATPWPATGIWSRAPLTAPEDLRGLRIRTYDAAGTTVMRAAGAVPQQISFADAVPRLRAGELDAVLSSGDGGAGARLWEVLPHFTVLNYASPLSLAFCRTASLEQLTEPERRAIEAAARETEARQFSAMATRGAENEARMRTNGVAINTVPALRIALAPLAGPVILAWARQVGPEGERILATYR